MMAAKPVIYAIEAGNDMVAESGSGISVPPEDSIAIARAILELSEQPRERLMKIGQNGRHYIVDRHDTTKLARQFMEGCIE